MVEINTTLGTPTEEEEESTELTVTGVALSVFALLLSIFIISVNSTTITLIRKTRALHTLSNIYVMSLAAADLVVGLGLIPLSLFYIPYIRVNYYNQNINFCVFVLGINLGMAVVSSIHMTLIAIDRYLYILRPYLYQKIVGKKLIFVELAITWLFGLFYALLPQLIHKRVSRKTRCDITELFPIGYMFYANLSIYTTCVTINITMYTQILYAAYKQRRSIHTTTARLDMTTPYEVHRNSTAGNSNRQRVSFDVHAVQPRMSVAAIHKEELQNEQSNALNGTSQNHPVPSISDQIVYPPCDSVTITRRRLSNSKEYSQTTWKNKPYRRHSSHLDSASESHRRFLGCRLMDEVEFHVASNGHISTNHEQQLHHEQVNNQQNGGIGKGRILQSRDNMFNNTQQASDSEVQNQTIPVQQIFSTANQQSTLSNNPHQSPNSATQIETAVSERAATDTEQTTNSSAHNETVGARTLSNERRQTSNFTVSNGTGHHSRTSSFANPNHIQEPGNSSAARPKGTLRTKHLRFFMTVFGVYFLCLTPTVVSMGVDYFITIPRSWYNMFNLLALLNSGMNFIIFVTLNKRFRHAVLTMLRIKRGGDIADPADTSMVDY